MILQTPVTILVIRCGAIGDVILATGVVRELFMKYEGQCRIDVATDYREVFDSNEYVHAVHLSSEIPNIVYDVVVNLDDAYETNPLNPIVDNYFYRAFGSTDSDIYDKSQELYLSDADEETVDKLVATIDGDFFCVHLRSYGGWPHKNIPPPIWESALIKVLTANDSIKIVCVGGPDDLYPTGHPRVLDGRSLSLGALSYLFDSALCFVGIDSAPFHVAGTSLTHLVALLNHAPPSQVLPFRDGEQGSNCTVVQAKVPCLGCYHKQPIPVKSIECSNPTPYECNSAWDTDEIATAILAQL